MDRSTAVFLSRSPARRMMSRLRFKSSIAAALLAGGLAQLSAQPTALNFKVFGYFQTSFGYHEELDDGIQEKSFSLQQLNLFLQKDLAPNWTAFVNFEFVNSYSSFRNWGAQNLEEAWVSYRRSGQFKLKLGLQIPAFNNLNEIKNKTPLLPYIIRPLAYESSFNEIIALEDFAPARAFVQASGYIPAREVKFDYAVFAGNSPNINSDPRQGQTGVDTTKFFLAGGRFGIRTGNLKLGVSATFDRLDFYRTALHLGYEPSGFRKIPRRRWGGDFSLNAEKWLWESEFIRVTYDDDHPALDFDKEFYYGTFGRQLTERFFAYAGYWVIREHGLPLQGYDLKALTTGAACNISETIFAKAQYGRVRFDSSIFPALANKSNYYFLAISAVF
jgi:hypothetical protein